MYEPESPFEVRLMEEVYPQSLIWLGYNDIGRLDVWVKSDGSNMTYQDWWIKQPYGEAFGNRHCSFLNTVRSTNTVKSRYYECHITMSRNITIGY